MTTVNTTTTVPTIDAIPIPDYCQEDPELAALPEASSICPVHASSSAAELARTQVREDSIPTAMATPTTSTAPILNNTRTRGGTAIRQSPATTAAVAIYARGNGPDNYPIDNMVTATISIATHSGTANRQTAPLAAVDDTGTRRSNGSHSNYPVHATKDDAGTITAKMCVAVFIFFIVLISIIMMSRDSGTPPADTPTMAPTSWTPPYDLSVTWGHGYQGVYYLILSQDGSKLTATSLPWVNGSPWETATGSYQSADEVIMSFDSGDIVKGKITTSGYRIEWENGTSWIRRQEPPLPLYDISGVWALNYDVSAALPPTNGVDPNFDAEISQDSNNKLTAKWYFWNDLPGPWKTATGSYQSEDQIIMSFDNGNTVKGKVTESGHKIEWENGTSWMVLYHFTVAPRCSIRRCLQQYPCCAGYSCGPYGYCISN